MSKKPATAGVWPSAFTSVFSACTRCQTGESMWAARLEPLARAFAARWRKALKRGPKFVAVTVDHGLRPEGALEAAAVKRLARKLGDENLGLDPSA